MSYYRSSLGVELSPEGGKNDAHLPLRKGRKTITDYLAILPLWMPRRSSLGTHRAGLADGTIRL